MEEQVRWLRQLDTAIECGRASVEAGLVYDADAVFDELEAQGAAMADERAAE